MLVDKKYEIVATGGTARYLKEAGIPCEVVYKVNEGRPNTVDMIKNDQIQLIINTTEGKKAISDSFTMRREALQHRVTYYTTMAGARQPVTHWVSWMRVMWIVCRICTKVWFEG